MVRDEDCEYEATTSNVNELSAMSSMLTLLQMLLDQIWQHLKIGPGDAAGGKLFGALAKGNKDDARKLENHTQETQRMEVLLDFRRRG